MPRKPLGDGPLTNAERQARHRAQRWRDAVAELVTLQSQYAQWFEALPESLQETATGEALEAIIDLDLDELIAIEPPRGFGRD